MNNYNEKDLIDLYNLENDYINSENNEELRPSDLEPIVFPHA